MLNKEICKECALIWVSELDDVAWARGLMYCPFCEKDEMDELGYHSIYETPRNCEYRLEQLVGNQDL